ncbi:hypothetical protein GCM10009603_56180 [Nocardiopsis exhalans]
MEVVRIRRRVLRVCAVAKAVVAASPSAACPDSDTRVCAAGTGAAVPRVAGDGPYVSGVGVGGRVWMGVATRLPSAYPVPPSRGGRVRGSAVRVRRWVARAPTPGNRAGHVHENPL